LASLALALEPIPADGQERLPTADALITPADVQATVTDALQVMAAAGVTAGYGLARYGIGAESDRLLWRSVSINQLLYAFVCREGNGASAHTPSRLLQIVFWAAAGGHLLTTLLSGGAGRAAGNVLALGVSAGLSRLLVKPPASAPTTFTLD
jgi:hypothetical protein